MDKTDADRITLSFSFTGIRISNILIWAAAGIASVLGTILTAVVVSKMMRPVYVLRYIYPVSSVAWMVLGTVISRLKGKKLYTVLLLAYMLVIFFPTYQTKYVNEKALNKTLQKTLAATQKEVASGDVILTDINHIAWTIASYYYPGTTVRQIDLSKFPVPEEGGCCWLIINSWKELGDISKQLESQGFSCEKIVEKGHLGAHDISVYRIRQL